MRVAASFAVAAALCLAIAAPAAAQQGAGVLSATHPGIGKVQTRIENYEQAIGVVTALQRESGDLKVPSPPNVDCLGTCFFPSRTEPVAWQCAPRQLCELHCTVSPPVGGCR